MEWSGQTGGTRWQQRALVVLFRHIHIRIIYAVMSVWLLYYIISRPKNTNAIYRFHRDCFRRNCLQACVDVYRSYYRFGEAITDRFAVYGGKKFNVEVKNKALFDNLDRSSDGFVMLFSHFGNTEIAGYSLRSDNKKLYILSYEGETETVKENRQKALEKNNMDIIFVKEDMSHVFDVYNAINQGNIILLTADRVIQSKTILCDFFNRKAKFPIGAFQLALSTHKPIIAIFAYKTNSTTYQIDVEPIEPIATGSRMEKVQNVAQQFATLLENKVKNNPYQWFNFYDFFK